MAGEWNVAIYGESVGKSGGQESADNIKSREINFGRGPECAALAAERLHDIRQRQGSDGAPVSRTHHYFARHGNLAEHQRRGRAMCLIAHPVE
jgi:hypothetical protein